MAKLADLPAGRQARIAGFKQKYMLYYIYVIRSKNRNYIYVGLTNNLNRRVSQHQNGKEKTTAPYRPFKILFAEQFLSRIDARNREKYLKSGSGKEWIKSHFIN